MLDDKRVVNGLRMEICSMRGSDACGGGSEIHEAYFRCVNYAHKSIC